MRKIDNIVILAAGDGTRFWPLSDKNTYPVDGTPLVSQVINQVGQYANRIITITNRTNDSLIKKTSSYKIVTVTVKDPSTSSMGKALLEHSSSLSGSTLVLNAVDVIDFKILQEIIEKTQKYPDFVFVGKKTEDYFPGGYVKFENDKVIGFVEKPKPDMVPSNIVKLVVDYFADIKKFINILEKTQTKNDDLYEQSINSYIERYKAIDYVLYDGFWITLKYPWHVLPMMKHFLSNMGDKIRLGKNVKIAPTAKIVGPCIIGDDTIIGDFAMIRECNIGKNCLIGGYSEVTRSYLGNNVSLHRNYVGDSVLDDNVLFGAGAATANFRFDAGSVGSKINGNKIDSLTTKLGAIIGSGSKIGVNATLCPGVKIGKNTLIGPGEVIESDVEDNKFMFKNIKVENTFNKKQVA